MIEFNSQILCNLLHIYGLAFGVGGSTISVLLMSKTHAKSKITSAVIELVRPIGMLTFLGLILLTASGVGFVIIGIREWIDLQILMAKHLLVFVLWIIGPFIIYLSSKLAKLAPKSGKLSSQEFLSVRSQVRALEAVGLVIWYATMTMSYIW